MKSEYPELAPCGIFCGACASYHSKTCKGCASNDREQGRCSKWNCKIRICCYDNKNLKYCIFCPDFPCKIVHNKLLKNHKQNKAYAYRHEIPAIFPKLKTITEQAYYDFQVQRWKCNECGGTIFFYYYTCGTCGKQKIIDKINN